MAPQRYRQSRNRKRDVASRGFALPTVIGIGLVLILVGMTMVFRSLSDQQSADAQSATVQSLITAETGIARVQSLLMKYPSLAATESAKWTVAIAETPLAPACGGGTLKTASPGTGSPEPTAATKTPNPLTSPAPTASPASPTPTPTPIEVSEVDKALIEAIGRNDWINVLADEPNQGQFKVLSYEPSNAIGQLNVQGRVGGNIISAATNSVQVDMPLEIPDPLIPGIWLRVSNQDSNLNPIRVKANETLASAIWIDDPDGLIGEDIDRLLPCDWIKERCKNPDYQRRAIANNKSFRPTPPKIPDDSQINTNSNAYRLVINLKDKQEYTFPRTTKTQPAVSADDTPDPDGNYRYLIAGDLRMQQEAALKVNPPAGSKVIFYLQGQNVVIGGNAKLNSNGTGENFEIYGSSNQQDYSLVGSGGGVETTNIILSSPSSVNAFIYAPAAEVKIGPASSIKGAVWSKTLDVGTVPQQGGAITITGLEQPKCLKDLEVGVTQAKQAAFVRPTKTWRRKPS